MNADVFAENGERIRPVRKGFLLLVAACAVYLVWWFVNYYPDSPYSDFVGKPVGLGIWFAMFAAVLVICLAAVRLIVRGLRSLTIDRSFLKVKNVLIACIVASVALPLLISFIRFITLDIFLIIWWAFLELCTADFLYGAHFLDLKTAKHSAIRTLIYAGVSLFLYIIYKMPPEYVRFVLGVIPILLFAVDMAWMAKQMTYAVQHDRGHTCVP